MRRLIAITLLTLAAVPLAAQPPASPAPSRPPAAQLRQDLQVILDQPEYRQGEGNWLGNYLRRLWNAFRNWYDERVARRFERLHDVSPFIYWTLVAVVAAAIIVLLYHIILTIRSAFGPAQQRRSSTGGASGETLEVDPHVLLNKADDAAAAGDFEQALRHLYLALIRNLDRHGLVRYDRSRTNYEYLREVRGQQDVAQPLATLTAQAEAVWYGEEPVQLSYYTDCRNLALAAWQGEAGHA